VSAAVSGLLFEVRRFAAEAAGADVGLLELEGRFRAPVRRRLGRPALVVEGDGDALEVRPTASSDAVAQPDGAPWRATFAVPLEALGARRFSLAVGRELLLDLPAPDGPPGDDNGATDRYVRLAREANAQRRRADDASDAAGAALARADAEREARERADHELEGVRLERDDLTRRLASVEGELAALRREQAEERVQHEQALETLRGEHAAALAARDEAAARAIEEGVSAAHAEANEAKRALKAARGDLEAARREAERERERAERAAAVVPRGYVAREPDAEVETEVAADAPATTRAQAGEEGVRVIGARPARRRARDERRSGRGPEPLPGTAAIGARHIEPGVTGSRSALAVWTARLLALACIAAVVLALALLLGLL
jgi:hypothetical protein